MRKRSQEEVCSGVSRGGGYYSSDCNHVAVTVLAVSLGRTVTEINTYKRTKYTEEREVAYCVECARREGAPKRFVRRLDGPRLSMKRAREDKMSLKALKALIRSEIPKTHMDFETMCQGYSMTVTQEVGHHAIAYREQVSFLYQGPGGEMTETGKTEDIIRYVPLSEYWVDRLSDALQHKDHKERAACA